MSSNDGVAMPFRKFIHVSRTPSPTSNLRRLDSAVPLYSVTA